MLKKIKQLFAPKSPLYPLILGLGSLMAVLVSLFTLQEMKTQRELSLTPMIFVQDFDRKYILADTICKENYLSNKIVLKNIENQNGQKLSECWHIDFINVGQGSAVDINATWEMDYKFFEAFFKTHEIDDSNFYVEVNDKYYGYRNKNCNKSGNAYRFSMNDQHHFSHLLSASSDKDGLQVPISSHILKFHIACFRAVWDKEGQNRDNTISTSITHRLTLTHSSVNGNKYIKKYDV